LAVAIAAIAGVGGAAVQHRLLVDGGGMVELGSRRSSRDLVWRNEGRGRCMVTKEVMSEKRGLRPRKQVSTRVWSEKCWQTLRSVSERALRRWQ
jgi:hypothetical protein